MAIDLLADIKSPGPDGRYSIFQIHARESREMHDRRGFSLTPRITILRLSLQSGSLTVYLRRKLSDQSLRPKFASAHTRCQST